jgi:hypothetical protein
MGNYLLAYRGGRMAETEEERNAQMAAWVRQGVEFARTLPPKR